MIAAASKAKVLCKLERIPICTKPPSPQPIAPAQPTPRPGAAPAFARHARPRHAPALRAPASELQNGGVPTKSYRIAETAVFFGWFSYG